MFTITYINHIYDSTEYQPQKMEDLHVEDVRRKAQENGRQGRKRLEEMTDEQK